MNSLRYGIVGNGIIGRATQMGLLTRLADVVYDLNVDTPFEHLASCDIVFFCIPTFDQQCIDTLTDLTVRLSKLNPAVRIVYRSTVPLGTCQRILDQHGISVTYMPEFLRERMWQTECLKPEVVVGQKDDFHWTAVFPHKKIIYCSWADAELIKMFSNNLNAMKTVFANHFYDLAEQTGADYNRVLTLWELTANNQTYLDANPELRGFGGKCLPKDLDFIIQTFEQLNIKQNLFSAIKEDNQKWPITKKS